MWSLTIPLLAAVAYAAPTAPHVEKRHFDCWGSNVQGCGYSTAGYSGAAVSVRLDLTLLGAGIGS